MKTSKRVEGLVQSDIRRMTRECVRLGGINLGQGICDMPTPPEILAATEEAVRQDRSIYSRYDGVDALREQVAQLRKRFYGEEVKADGEVLVTIGATGGFAATCQSLLNPGDEVIVFEPYYGYHLNTMLVSGQTPRFVTLSPPDWTVTRAMLDAAVTDKTRAIVVNTPVNPSGKVFSRAELEVIAAFCKDHDLLAITDEIYEFITYDDHTHVPLSTLDGMRERTVTISGFSKTFAITGWRLGYVVAPEALAGPIGLVNDLFYVCAPSPLQYGVAEGMAQLAGGTYYADMRALYQAKRDRFCAVLDRVGLTPVWPQGAYYVLADVSGLGCATARDAAMHILERVGVASVPGSAFFQGDAGESMVRFCFAKRDDVLEEACVRLEGLSG